MRIKGFLLLTAVVATLAACEKESNVELSQDDANIISFVSIHPSQTKVTDTNFEVNDAIGVYMTLADSDLQLGGNEMNNEKFIYDGSTWNATRKMYWNEGLHNVYAYYPYVGTVNDIEDFTFTVALDQNSPASADKLGGYESSDFLWASTPGVEGSEDPVTLTFSHRMSKVLVKLTKSEDYEGDIPSDVEVYIHNTVPVASISLSTGDVSKNIYASAETIKTRKLTNSEYTACLVPQNIETRRPLVEVVTSGVSYLMEGKISLKQGYMHTIVIELSKNPDQTKIEIGGGIGGWN
jgi:hypothetical protein